MYVEGFYNNVPSFRNIFLEYQFDPNYVGNILSGLKWQCIEFVRRYFIEKYHITFKSVKNVYDMLNLNSFIIIKHLKTLINFITFFFQRSLKFPVTYPATL